MAIRPRAVHHVGIPVSSLARSLDWYKEMLGLEAEFTAEVSGEATAKAVGVPGADLLVGFMRIGNTMVELLEYRSPRGSRQDRGNNDIGAMHLAFEVDDIEDAYRLLRDRGVSFNSPPVWIDRGPLAGCAFCYFTDPDNVQLELFQTAGRDEGRDGSTAE
jgi:lactoylglutathione lyase